MSIEYVPSLFRHECLTDEQANQAIADIKPTHRTILGMKECTFYQRAQKACVVGCIVGAACAVSLPFPYWIVAVGIGVFSLIMLLGVNERLTYGPDKDGFTPRQHDRLHELQSVSNSDLQWLEEQCASYPMMRKAISTWVNSGQAIRERDLRACRIYINRERPRAERAALLNRLSVRSEQTV